MKDIRRIGLLLACVAIASVAGCQRAGDAPSERYLDVDAGGHRLHMLVVGEQGPTVVLESGWPGCGLGWDRVRGPVAQFARVVTYDRAGTGKSESGPLPRHAEQIARELHTALKNAALDPPYILVGQSLGGPYVRVFAKMYPDEISGMVLVDPTQPDACEPVEQVKEWLAAHCPEQLQRVEATLPSKVPPGYEIMLLSRIKRLEQGLADVPEPRQGRLRREWWAAIDNLPAVADTIASISPGARDEMKSAPDTFRQTVAARPLPQVPIILLAAGRPDMDMMQAMSPAFRELNRDNRLGSTSIVAHTKWVEDTPGAKLIVVRNSGHNIQSERPRVVIDAVREVVERANQRGNSDEPAARTTLGIDGTRFTINGKPTFLLGMSYYGALGAKDEFWKQDLDDMQAAGINWIRVWANWGAFENNVAAVDVEGRPREKYLERLKKLVQECDRRGMIVDVSLSRGNGVSGPPRLQTLEAHRRAVETLVSALKEERNWYLDLSNERNIQDKRFTSFEDLSELRALVRKRAADRLVTASHAGDITDEELRAYVNVVKVDFIAPHRPRQADSPGQTKQKTIDYLAAIKKLDRVVPVHYQEPFRRGYGFSPSVADYVTDLEAAIAGGAGGWCFHNGDTRDAKDGRPRRSFDLSEKRLFDQFDEVEKAATRRLGEFARPQSNDQSRQ